MLFEESKEPANSELSVANSGTATGEELSPASRNEDIQLNIYDICIYRVGVCLSD